MSVQTQINRIKGNVTAALTAIAEKGVSVPSGSDSDDLAALIGAIVAGGGGGSVTAKRGTITPASSATSIAITHNLGAIPKLFFCYRTTNVEKGYYQAGYYCSSNKIRLEYGSPETMCTWNDDGNIRTYAIPLRNVPSAATVNATDITLNFQRAGAAVFGTMQHNWIAIAWEE